MKQIRWKRLLTLSLSFALTFALFQNCSGAFKAATGTGLSSESFEVCDPTAVRSITNPTTGDLQTQVVTLSSAAACKLSPGDESAQYQVLSDGMLAFQSDLKAGETKDFSIARVLANGYPIRARLQIQETDQLFTLSNEFYTVSIRKRMDLTNPLTPIEAIQPKSGNIRLRGSLHFANWADFFHPFANPAPRLKEYRFEVLERGPLLTRVKATYRFSNTAANYGSQEVFPANEDAFSSEIYELRAGVNAVFAENETNYNWISGLEIENLNVNQLRYRGHSASSIEAGYTIDESGARRVYQTCCDGATATPYLMAIRDVTSPLSMDDYNTNPFVPVWNPWASNGGRFVLARNAQSRTGQYVALMGGSPSRAIGTAYSGVKFIGQGQATKVAFQSNGRTPSAGLFRHIRYPWALTIGTEPIAEGQILPEAGVIQNQQISSTLSKLIEWAPSRPDETFSSQTLYLSKEAQRRLVDRIKSDPVYAESLIARDGYATDLIRYIREPSLSRSQQLYNEVITTRANMLDAFWFKNGYYEHRYGYWMGALEMLRHLPRIPFLLEDPNLTAQQKATVYSTMLFFGFLMQDGDFVPLKNHEQFNMGTANMPVQYQGQMDALLLVLLNNPRIKKNFGVDQFAGRLFGAISSYINDFGASKGSPHYTAAGTVPSLNMCQQAQVAGALDCATQVPRMTNFGRFMLDLLTPPERRFGTRRKMITFGDGSIETTEIHGQLGTLLSRAQPALSAQLMEAWNQMGSPHSGFYQSSIFKIDENLPKSPYTLGDASYPGYLSVMRSGFGGLDESAIWFLHGEFYSDHRHTDSGAPYMYLLGAPIALSWSSMYSPHIGGSLMHNGLTALSANSWNGAGASVPSLGEGNGSFTTKSVTSTLAGQRPMVSATFDLDAMTTWTRTVTLNRELVTQPIVIISDQTAGASARQEKVLNLNLMMTGPVLTPQGSITPPAPGALPSNTGFMNLGAGWSRFEMQGQWGVHLILLVQNEFDARYQLGNFSHTWSPGGEMGEFRQVNGREYSESQYQFRLWSTGASKFVLIPYRASGAKPNVVVNGGAVTVDGRAVVAN